MFLFMTIVKQQMYPFSSHVCRSKLQTKQKTKQKQQKTMQVHAALTVQHQLMVGICCQYCLQVTVAYSQVIEQFKMDKK